MSLDDLRRATRSDHEAVERLVVLMKDDVTVDDYRDYLVRMSLLHGPIEAELALLAELPALLPDLERRWKAPLLRADLGALGGSQTASHDAVPVGSVAHAFGCLYVLEGSTLGAQVIRRHVSAALGPAIEGACSYLTGYGAEAGAMWRSFGAALTRFCESRGQLAAVVEGARLTFAAAHTVLSAKVVTS